MAKHSIPAPGFSRVSGKRSPPRDWEMVWCQLRSGWVDEFGPWPVADTEWIWTGSDADVVAVKRADSD